MGPPPLFVPTEGYVIHRVLYRSGLPRPGIPGRPPVSIEAPKVRRAGSGTVTPPMYAIRDCRVHSPSRPGLLKRTVDRVKAADGVSFTLRTPVTRRR